MAAISPLLYADSSQNADPLYFGKVSIPDPFICFGHRGKRYAVVSALEYGRVKRDSAFDVVLPLEDALAEARKKYPQRKITAAEVISLLARTYKVSRFTVPDDFPAGLAQKLTDLGIKYSIAEGPLFPEREIKSAAEARAIKEGNRCSALGIAAAERILRASKRKGRTLLYRGEVLTSERVKVAVETACLEAGAISVGTIVAGGDQGCDPHERGSGPLRPDELIIVDVFPRVTASGYHGDMTRTFLRGRASDAQQAIVDAVREAQKAALKKIRAGVNGQEVHAQCLEVFARRQFKTERRPEGSVGFFHGTGHGLGLAVHEAPRVSTVDCILKLDTVVTVEPGLYYPGIGGCRIEDVVQVGKTGPKMLSSYSYDWELR